MGKYNLFTYCGNNPVNNVDPSGYGWYNAIKEKVSDAWDTVKTSVKKSWDKVTGHDEDALDALYSEHSKKGTTNQSNKNKHEKGQTRQQKDNRGEKGDARRVPNPNKRISEKINIDSDDVELIVYSVIIVSATATIVYLVANDITGVRIGDDVLIAPLIKIIWDSSTKIIA